jgi:threonine/homoserine/homoserine lactone efflux protein
MTTEILIALAGFALVSSITPGPNNLMLLASGTNFGWARSLPHMLGVAFGFTLMVLLVGLGLSQIFVLFPVAHLVLKAVCVTYLLYLAWKIAIAPPPSQGEARGKPMTFLQAAAFQWVNPKGWTMALTAVSAYAITGDIWSYVVVAAVFGIVNLPSISVWMAMGVQMRRLLNNPRALRAFNVGAALLLVASLYPIVVGH